MPLSYHLERCIDEFMFHPFLFFLISSFSVYLFTKWLFKPPSNKTQLPSPPRLPILGNLHQLGILTHRSLQSLGNKYGPLMLLHFGSKPVIIVQSANAAMEIMKKHDLAFADKATSSITRRLLYDGKDISVAPYGEYWRKLKSLCVLQLLSNKRVNSLSFIREEETLLLMTKIKATSSSRMSLNLSEMFVSLTNDMICRSAFGRKYSDGEDGKKFTGLLVELMQLLGSLNIGEFIPSLWWISRLNGFDARVKRVAKELDVFLDLVIQEHLDPRDDTVKDGDSRENFLAILLEIHKENANGTTIDRDNVKAIILDLILGGTDTTSATLEWAMTEILRHPLVLNKLQEEVREILRGKEIIADSDLEKMHYLKAVVRETLRCHTPIALVARVAREDVNVMGFEIAKGTMILINTWAIARDPASWDEPEQFNPERFLNSSKDFMGLDFAFIPFGAGRRRCPGIAFATANVELVLATLLQNFTWDLPDGMNLEDLDSTEGPGVTLHRKNPLFAVATHYHF